MDQMKIKLINVGIYHRINISLKTVTEVIDLVQFDVISGPP